MQRLSEFGQASPRTYMQIVLAFPLAGSAPASTIYQHLRASLTRVGKDFPLFTCEVHLKKSRFGEEAFILPSSGIPLWTEIGDTNYANLAVRGFPAQEFIHRGLDLNNTLRLDDGPVPVAHVRVKLIDGGLLLMLSLHHTVGDAYCLGLFAQAFAAATCGERVKAEHWSPKLQLPQDEDISSSTLLTLSRDVPEYEVLLNPNPSPSLPDILPGGIPSEDIPGASKIFALKIDHIEELCNMVCDVWGPTSRKPSAFACMAALTWAHVTKARIGSESDIAPPCGNADIGRLFTPLDFRRRFHDETEEYFGNAIVTVPTDTSVEELQAACEDRVSLAKIVAQVTATFSNVDQAGILRREALFKRTTDYRRLALNQDRRIPGHMKFDSHRYFGGNDVWELPGMGMKKPDSVRTVQGAVSLGNVLILPLNSESDVYEISVQLPQVSMAALLQDEDWMFWVHRIIG